jgi:hypothetical protein
VKPNDIHDNGKVNKDGMYQIDHARIIASPVLICEEANDPGKSRN